MPKPEPLPDVRQSRNFDCATAAWRTVYQYQQGRNARILDLSHPIAGTDPATLEAVIRRDSNWHVHAGETLIDDLRHYGSTLRPAICLITPEDDSHYVVVGGVWRGRVYLQDPCEGWCAMTEADFVAAWHGLGKYKDFERWSLVAWPVVF
jgi:predicted double-glycine peptidase